ncbi:11256_t:CDS:2, partial [Funneliformis geosporum]
MEYADGGVIKLADFSLSKRIEAVSNQSKEISSGRPPFCEPYDLDLAIEISQGLRENIIPDTPKDYVKIYTVLGQEPDNRPTMNEIVDGLNAIITKATSLENNKKNKESNLQLSKQLPYS